MKHAGWPIDVPTGAFNAKKEGFRAFASQNREIAF